MKYWFNKKVSVWTCQGDGCHAVIKLKDKNSSKLANTTQNQKGIKFQVDNDVVPQKHLGCEDNQSRFVQVTTWYCQHCGAGVDASKVPFKQKRATIKLIDVGNRSEFGDSDSTKKNTIEITYSAGRPLRHVGCEGQNGATCSVEMGEWFQPHPSTTYSRFEARKVREDAVTKGNGTEAPGVWYMGMGVLLQNEDNASSLPLNVVTGKFPESGKPKNHVVDRKKHFDDSIEKRRALLGETPDFYLPSGVQADTGDLLSSYALEAGDTRVHERSGRGSVGLDVSRDFMAGLRGELYEKTKAGDKSVTCFLHHERYRLFFDPQLGASEDSLNNKFTNNFLGTGLQGMFGNRYIKEVFVGGVLRIKMTKRSGEESKKVEVKGGLTMEDGVAAAGAKFEGSIQEAPLLVYDCEVDEVGGGKLAKKQLHGRPVEDILELVDEWVKSLERFEDLKPIRVLVGTFDELYIMSEQSPSATLR